MREFRVCRITALRTECNGIFPRRAGGHKLMSHCAAHHPGIALDLVERDAAPPEYPAVCLCVHPVVLPQSVRVSVKTVAVFHDKLTGPQNTAFRSRLIPEFCLNLVPHLWQFPVRTDFHGCEPCNDLFMGHAETHLSLSPVFQSEHLFTDTGPPACFLPDLCGMKRGHGNFLSANRIHFFTDDSADLFNHPLGKGKINVQTGRKLSYVSRPYHEYVTHRFGVGRCLTKGRYEHF